jgi:hypothetical protein
MSRFCNLRTISIHTEVFYLRTVTTQAKIFSTLWDEGCLAQLLPASFKSLVISSEYFIDDSTGPEVHIAPVMDGKWLRETHGKCGHLRSLGLDINLAPAASVDLERLLFSAPLDLTVLSLDIRLPKSVPHELKMLLIRTKLEHLTLSPLVDDVLSDWGIAFILAPQYLVSLGRSSAQLPRECLTYSISNAMACPPFSGCKPRRLGLPTKKLLSHCLA